MIANFDMQKFEKSFAEIVRLKDNGRINVNNPVQRGYVWNNSRDSLLIDSLCRGIAISVFYYNKAGKIYELLEGKQRIEAVSNFMKDKYKLHSSLSPVLDDDGNEIQLARKLFSQLPESLRNKITQTVPLAQYGENMTLEQKKIFFTRINSGRPVTAAEIARIGIISRDVVFELIEHPAIVVGVSEANKRKCIDEDIVKYIWAMFNLEEPNFDNRKLGKLLEKREITEKEKDEIKRALDYLNILFIRAGENKPLVSKMKYRTHMVSLAYMANIAITMGIGVEEYAAKAIAFFNTESRKPSISDAYNRASASRVGNPEQIKTRMYEISQQLQ